MPDLSCKKPLVLYEKVDGLWTVERRRCRWCSHCRVVRQLEWFSRLVLEDWKNDYPPQKIDLTYSDVSVASPQRVTEFIRRLKYHGIALRWFCATELGSRS